jgi:hypothetical protein
MCKLKIGSVSVHTRDQISEMVQESRSVLTASAGSMVACECEEGKATPEACSGFTLYDPDGTKIATFKVGRFGASQLPDGSIRIYSVPVLSESTPTQDSTPIPCRDFTAHFSRLAQLNTKNTDFWQKRNAAD